MEHVSDFVLVWYVSMTTVRTLVSTRVLIDGMCFGESTSEGGGGLDVRVDGGSGGEISGAGSMLVMEYKQIKTQHTVYPAASKRHLIPIGNKSELSRLLFN
ncbi:hypothetical protein J1N35_038559 [Gossypium stocksii]|uniref:Uncharacterized protein n=1 Tax=Gossypium stocksii TaxID=47602 RepID=A0A9D3UMP9_9ROSI|nr:hypothetical protein J1N35_038559 [Gossypium stocksii]